MSAYDAKKIKSFRALQNYVIVTDMNFKEKLTASLSNIPTPIDWRRDIGDRGGKAKVFYYLGASSRANLTISKDKNIPLPLLLYYGAGRLWDTHRRVSTEKPGSQLSLS